MSILNVRIHQTDLTLPSCLRNIMSIFHHIEKEWAWRQQKGKPEGFDTIKAHTPIVAIGAEEPLADQKLMADHFHGIDGLAGIHSSHPHLTPEETWKDLFSQSPTSMTAQEVVTNKRLFTPSNVVAHEEILRILRDNEPDTITIVAIGPLTNLALAAATDTRTFLRAKEVVVMGGAIDFVGNVSSRLDLFATHLSASPEASTPHCLYSTILTPSASLSSRQTANNVLAHITKSSEPDNTSRRVQHFRRHHSCRTCLCPDFTKPEFHHATHSS